jgi:acetyl-CoA carboxylase carboxyltransferase component
MNSYLDRLEGVRRENLAGGGKERLELQGKLGKLTARERIDLLVDTGTFDEIGSLVTDSRTPFDGKTRPSPSDGVVMGLAKINGSPVALYSMDFSVMSGSLGDQAVWKLVDLTKMAGQNQMPLIGIIDSAGERLSIKGGDSGLNGIGRLFREYCFYSGIIPRITLLLGPCTGLLASIPVLSDFLIMNEETGFLWLGGNKESDEAGTAEFHMERSGQCDIVATNDEDAIEKTKILLSYRWKIF